MILTWLKRKLVILSPSKGRGGRAGHVFPHNNKSSPAHARNRCSFTNYRNSTCAGIPAC